MTTQTYYNICAIWYQVMDQKIVHISKLVSRTEVYEHVVCRWNFLFNVKSVVVLLFFWFLVWTTLILDNLGCKIEVCLISCSSWVLALFQWLLVQSNQMLWSTTILRKMREVTTSMTLVVIFGSRIVSFPLVWIRFLVYIVFALTRGVLWSGSVELFILSLLLYIVNLK